MTPKRERLWLLPAVAVATFGPYLLGGVRAEQVAVYGLLVTGLLARPWYWTQVRPPILVAGIFAVWGTYFLVAAASSIGGHSTLLPHQPRSVAAGADNLLLPVACLLAALIWVRPANWQDVLRKVCTATALLSAANAALAVTMTRVDLSPLLRQFWAADSIDGSLTPAEMALQLGRAGGIFGQPAEAGLMCGTGALCAIYVWHDRPGRLFPLLAVLFAGGAVSVSKVFLLVAAPIILWQAWRLRRGKTAVLATVAVGSIVVWQSGLFDRWDGLDYLLRLFNPAEGSVVELYTAGRFGDTSSLTTVVAAVTDASPVFGVGIGGLLVPYDNGFVEAYVMAGAVGVTLYAVTLLLLWRLSRRLEQPARSLISGLALLATLSSMGIPALTANRAGTILWLIVGVAALALDGSASRVAPRRTVGPDRLGQGRVVVAGARTGSRRGRPPGGREPRSLEHRVPVDLGE